MNQQKISISAFLLGAISNSLGRLPSTPYDLTKIKKLTVFTPIDFWTESIPEMFGEAEGDFSCIEKMTNLHTLSFANSNGDTFIVNDFSFLPKCQKLHTLDLENTNFTDCRLLLNLPNLRKVSLPEKKQLINHDILRDLTNRNIQVSVKYDIYNPEQEVTTNYSELIKEIYSAVKTILTDLFKNNEHYYYITLVSDGGAQTPCISAWSYEALNRQSNDEAEKEMIKWSYADSPYCCWKQEEFNKVKDLLCEVKNIWEMADDDFYTEYDIRYTAMEAAMQKLDREGFFEINQLREDVVVLVETMPPDNTNTERAYRMNNQNSKIFNEWLEEAAEI